MRHHNRRALSDKQNAINMFSCRKANMKSCNTGISAPCHSSACSSNKTEESNGVTQKAKRLKTVKQRNQIRGHSLNRSNQSRQHCERGSKDKGPCGRCQDCRRSRPQNFCITEKPVAKSFPLQKPSIITEGRLTSIRGLFSHKVRSVDIERLVKEKRHQKHIEKQKGQTAANHSPSPSGLNPISTPLGAISETSDEGISACTNKDQKSKTLEKTDCLQSDLEGTVSMTVHSEDGKHNSAQTHTDANNAVRSGSLSDQKGIQEAVILSSSDSEPVHKSFPTSVKVSLSDHSVIPKKKNTRDQKQSNKATAAMDVQHVYGNSERPVTPAGPEVLNADSPQFKCSPAIFTFSSPTQNRERSALGNENQHRKPGLSSKEEAVSRLAARLCHNFDSFPLQRCCPLLTECRKVLLHHLHERHGSQLQHNLHKLHSCISEEDPRPPLNAEQVWPSSLHKYLDNTPMHFSYTRKHEGDQQREAVEFQTDNGSQKYCVQEGFCENVERGAATKKQRTQNWGLHSHQDFIAKLQRPCEDPLSQWSIIESQESLRAKHHPNSQTFSLHQAFTGPQIPTPWSYNCTNHIMDPFCLEPQKQVKLGSGENRRRHSTALPLLEQWRNDPDLHFLFQDENSTRSHTSLGPLTEVRACSPHHDIVSISERPTFGASSTGSAFLPPEGFCYEPYYRFPHPSNSFNRLEKSDMTLYTQPDFEKRHLGPSLQLPTPYFYNLP